jgi:ribose transport system ATP-binding protein
MSAGSEALLRLDGVSKRYGGVRALERADLVVQPGAVHAILGENGAGKSTLIEIIAGVIQPDEGTIRLDGRDMRFASPAEASAAGVACIFQELSLIPDLSVADNIVASHPPLRFGMIDRRRQRAIAEEALARLAAKTFRRWRPCAICRSRADSWSKSPRRWRANPAY